MSKIKTSTLVLTSFIGGVAFLASCGGSSISSSEAASNSLSEKSYVYDANNINIGRLFGLERPSGYLDYVLTVETEKNYIFFLEGRSNDAEYLMSNITIYYEGINCTGQAYVKGYELENLIYRREYGTPYNQNAYYYYIPQDQSIYSITLASKFTQGNSCIAASGSLDVKEISVNNEEITGFSNSGVTGPVNIRIK